MDVVGIVLLLAVAGFVLFNLFRSRKRRMEEAERSGSTAPATGLAVSRDLFEDNAQHAPVESFHVVGDEARVTFDVPLDDEDDEVLNDLLMGEAGIDIFFFTPGDGASCAYEGVGTLVNPVVGS